MEDYIDFISLNQTAAVSNISFFERMYSPVLSVRTPEGAKQLVKGTLVSYFMYFCIVCSKESFGYLYVFFIKLLLRLVRFHCSNTQPQSPWFVTTRICSSCCMQAGGRLHFGSLHVPTLGPRLKEKTYPEHTCLKAGGRITSDQAKPCNCI